MSFLPFPSGFRYRVVALLVLLACDASPALSAAETVRQWTDTQGRTMRATLLESTATSAKIRREDGQIFTLELEKLSPTDRAYVADAVRAAAAVRPVKIELTWSRGQFDVERSGGGDESALMQSTEQWGYAVTVQNMDTAPVEELRVEYALFVKPDVEPGRDGVKPDLRHTLGTQRLPRLALREATTFRTEPILITRQQLKSGWRWGKTGTREPMRDTLEGIWVRVYRGEQLVLERASSESLKRGGWPAASDY